MRLIGEALGFVGSLILAWAVWVTLRAIALKLWRAGCCARGYHRETVESRDVVKTTRTPYGSYRIGSHRQTVLRCLDCPHEVVLSDDTVFTPSRRVRAA
ncbi:hypothetical protein [Humibacter sp.]|uniref:hypothetical protein n=1 Tax=Humibacter sp. TaxID=1940291 RepID=UPI003F81CD4A